MSKMQGVRRMKAQPYAEKSATETQLAYTRNLSQYLTNFKDQGKQFYSNILDQLFIKAIEFISGYD